MLPPRRPPAKLHLVSVSALPTSDPPPAFDSGSAVAAWWRGAPRPVTCVTRRLWPAWPVAWLTLLVGLWWEYQAVAGHHLIVYPLLGWLLPLAGLYGVAGHPLWLWYTARGTRYTVDEDGLAVTWGRRATRGWRLAAAAVPPARLVPAPGGLVDVWLDGPPPRVARWGWWQPSESRPVLRCLAAADAAAAAAALARVRSATEQAGAAPGAWAMALATPTPSRGVHDTAPPGEAL